jgi:hypothetical protein
VTSEVITDSSGMTFADARGPLLFGVDEKIAASVRVEHDPQAPGLRRCHAEDGATQGRGHLHVDAILVEMRPVDVGSGEFILPGKSGPSVLDIQDQVPGHRHQGKLTVVTTPDAGLVCCPETDDGIDVVLVDP